MRVTKAQWYKAGGFRVSRCYRKATKNGAWRYYMTPESE